MKINTEIFCGSGTENDNGSGKYVMRGYNNFDLILCRISCYVVGGNFVLLRYKRELQSFPVFLFVSISRTCKQFVCPAGNSKESASQTTDL